MIRGRKRKKLVVNWPHDRNTSDATSTSKHARIPVRFLSWIAAAELEDFKPFDGYGAQYDSVVEARFASCRQPKRAKCPFLQLPPYIFHVVAGFLRIPTFAKLHLQPMWMGEDSACPGLPAFRSFTAARRATIFVDNGRHACEVCGSRGESETCHIRRSELTAAEKKSSKCLRRFGTIGGVDLPYCVLHSLQPKTWLNDEVINCWGRAMEAHGNGSCKFMSTFFWGKMHQDGFFSYDQVKNQTHGKNPSHPHLFQFCSVFVPMNPGRCHWAGMTACFETCTATYHDSLSSGKDNVGEDNCLRDLVKYVQENAKDYGTAKVSAPLALPPLDPRLLAHNPLPPPPKITRRKALCALVACVRSAGGIKTRTRRGHSCAATPQPHLSRVTVLRAGFLHAPAWRLLSQRTIPFGWPTNQTSVLP